MPEGHTLHRIARHHRRLLAGRAVHADSPQGRFVEGAQRIDGHRVDGVEAWGKHLLYAIHGADYLHVHLGLYGKFRDGILPAPEAKGALRLRMITDEVWIELRGATACELLEAPGREAVIARLGPDVLRSDARASDFVDRAGRSRAPIGGLVMDQSVVAGVGNVFRAEAPVPRRARSLPSGSRGRCRPAAGAVGRPDRADARRGPLRADRHHPAGGPGSAKRARAQYGRPLRLPSRGGTVPPLRHRDPPGRDGRPQPVLVPSLPAVTASGLPARRGAVERGTSTGGGPR